MAVARLFLNGVTREPRQAAVGAARSALSAAGAWVLDYHEYSNLSVAIGFEVPAQRARALAAGLAALPVAWKAADLAALASYDGPTELTGALELVFVHNEPDLKQTIPAVPG